MVARPRDYPYGHNMNDMAAHHDDEAVAPRAVAAGGPVVSERGFWLAFSLGWLALAGVFVSAGVAEGSNIGGALLGAVIGVGPFAALGVLVALRRRRLLRPEWTIGRTLAVHLVVGLVYALAAAVLGTIIHYSLGMEWVEANSAATPAVFFVFRVVSGFFFYAILAGFLMWTESLVRVHESRTVAAREAGLRAEAEAKALRAQFNPHFVFNTLHSLMLLVRAEPERAERAIEDVATLIRYASVLQREGVDKVPLDKEVVVARRYAALERLRLEDRLRLEWSVAPDVGHFLIPAFSLQSLLENAIKHAVAPSTDAVDVWVRATRVDGHLLLEVADDGPGTDPAIVAAARGHGIDLLARRLASLYSADASLDYETSPGAGFRVTLRVPVEVADAPDNSREPSRARDDAQVETPVRAEAASGPQAPAAGR